jgi:hypothetical protein
MANDRYYKKGSRMTYVSKSPSTVTTVKSRTSMEWSTEFQTEPLRKHQRNTGKGEDIASVLQLTHNTSQLEGKSKCHSFSDRRKQITICVQILKPKGRGNLVNKQLCPTFRHYSVIFHDIQKNKTKKKPAYISTIYCFTYTNYTSNTITK